MAVPPEDDRRSGADRRETSDSKPKVLPPWGVALLILAMTIAIGSATYNFTNLVTKHEELRILSASEFESVHLYRLKNDIEVGWLKEQVVEMKKSQDTTLQYLRALAQKQGLKVKEN